MANKYDQMEVDINELFGHDCKVPAVEYPGYLRRISRRYITSFLMKNRHYARLVDASIIRSWFNEFELYWRNVLKGRPLYMHDFFYLLGVYRQRFQEVETPANSSEREFLDSWRKPETLYMLFGAVRRYAYDPMQLFYCEEYVQNGDSICEYGCGVAPITFSLMNYSKKRNLSFAIADIRQINSHFAKVRLGENAEFIDLQPFENNLPTERFNVVTLKEVMEHLPNPLDTVRSITESLKPNGILVFDYILGDGDGQDTIEAIEQRPDVLRFISHHFNVIEGQLLIDSSMDRTVCRLK
jgi:2-polyprenyl-3-methyl-5-hydroxy-6-metoxy-1,4-benzoquinol methylase